MLCTLLAFPPAVCAKKHISAFEYAAFVTEAIQEKVESGCAVRVPTYHTICSPLQVIVNVKRKCRLAIDLQYVNQYLHLSNEGVNVLFSSGDYVFLFKLKSGYHHVDIHNDSQTYPGVRVSIQSSTCSKYSPLV